MSKRLIYLVSFVFAFGLCGSIASGQENQIINGEFDDGLDSWGSYGSAGFTIEVVSDAGLSGNNAALINVTDASAGTSIGLPQGGFDLVQGETYPFGFTAKADQDREMVVLFQLYKPEGPSWIDIIMTRVALTTEPQTFVLEYTHEDDSTSAHPTWEVSMYLMLKGAWWAMTGSDMNSKVWIDRVYFGAEPPAPQRGPAVNPNPADGQTDVPRDVVISWTPGEFAAPINGHKVYFGESFDDVNDAIGGIAQDANSYARPQRLDFNTTYYWRVDEVNAPPTSHIEFKGEVRQFTTEPIAYPIAGENITATVSSTHQADTDPENTINGSGLDVNDLHSMEAADMWLSGDEPNGAWIEYELDKVYKLHEMWVWNYNQVLESILGFGLKDVTIEYSTNGTDYTTLGTTHEFARAPGAPDYAHNTTVDFGGAAAKYVRLTANSNWGALMLPQYGLSEVRFLYIPVLAREPSPDSGTTDVAVDITLSFRAGREADKHDVYLSSDEQAVIDGNAPVTTVTETSFGPLSLDLGTTYYWKTNEVNEAETTTTWQGDIWNFTTHEYFVVDDFEDYNDYPPDEIWSTWVDGYLVPANGATVGYPAPDWGAGEHYVETAIVHGGEQAMPFFYDNTGTATYSEGERTFAVPQDWAKAGVQTLALYFHGSPGNAGQLYVKANGSKVVYDGDASNLALAGWQAWNIDLASFGTSLQSVTTLAIGIDGNGASGTLYFDDIRLYARSREFITPAEPSSAGLVGQWKFDEGAGTIAFDSSGLGNDGTFGGDPQWVAGYLDGALEFNGDDWVDCGDVLTITEAITIACWVNPAELSGDNGWVTLEGAYAFKSGETSLKFTTPGVLDYIASDTVLEMGTWQHVAVTFVPNQAEGAVFYLNGVEAQRMDSTAMNPGAGSFRIGNNEWDQFYEGMIDEVRLYDYILSYGEAAWLAGRTEPFDKPF